MTVNALISPGGVRLVEVPGAWVTSEPLLEGARAWASGTTTTQVGHASTLISRAAALQARQHILFYKRNSHYLADNSLLTLVRPRVDDRRQRAHPWAARTTLKPALNKIDTEREGSQLVPGTTIVPQEPTSKRERVGVVHRIRDRSSDGYSGASLGESDVPRADSLPLPHARQCKSLCPAKFPPVPAPKVYEHLLDYSMGTT